MIDREPMGTRTQLRYARLAADGRQAWPGIEVPEKAFSEYVAQRDAGGDLNGTDLYLACACSRGDRIAIEKLDQLIVDEARSAVRRIDPSDAFVSEVQQALRRKLLMPEGGRSAKIDDYAGRGPLRKWLRAAALRTALNLAGDRRGTPDTDDALLDLPAKEADPELAYVIAKYRGEFKAAFQAATATLSAQERNVLRLHFLQSLSIDQIGTAYRVHRSTVARWIAKAREQLLHETRSRLQERLRLASSELESLMGDVRSQLSVSIQKYL
jgi:RNA polymerase sigma-70 factor, ECF subfamily